MALILVLGRRGDGKTLFLVLISQMTKRKIWSNFILYNNPRYEPLRLIDLFHLPNDIELFLDEGYTWIESRTSSDHLNIYCSYIAFQLRKRKMNIFMTAQQYMTLDVRFRNEADYIVKCTRKNNGEDDRENWDFQYSIFDMLTGRITVWDLPYYDAIELFDYFDTYEIIEPYNVDELEANIIKKDNDLYWEKVGEIVDVLKPRFNGREITHATVRAEMFKEKIPKTYAVDVYLILKGKMELN